MQTYEQIIDWQNRPFIDALFTDLKILQLFKVSIPEETKFTDAVTKELICLFSAKLVINL